VGDSDCSADSHPDKTEVISGTCMSTAIGITGIMATPTVKIREALERSIAISARMRMSRTTL
jgi:hypothetical protein